MIRIPQIIPPVYSKETYDVFAASLTSTGCTVTAEGASFNGKTVYSLKTGDSSKRPVIYIQGGIHGDEWQSCYWVRKFAELVANPQNAGAARRIFKKLKAELAFVIVPCINPDGLDLNTRGTANLVDLNRNYDAFWASYDDADIRTNFGITKGASAFSEPESRISRDIVLLHKPLSFVCCHTNPTSNFTQHSHIDNMRFHTLFKEYGKSFRITTDESIMDTPGTGRTPVSAAWATNQISKSGAQIISSVFEIGDRTNNARAMRCGVAGLTLLALQVLHWHKTKSHLMFN